MIILNKVTFGKLNVPQSKEIDKSAQFTSIDFSEVSKDINLRMYPFDAITGQAIEHSTNAVTFELSGWVVEST